MREGVAAVGFTPGGTQKVTATLAGVEDEGRVLRRGEDHPTDRVHSLKHAKVGREWPEGTTHEEYIRSLSEVILDRRSGMLFSEFKDKGRQLAFVRRSGELRGPGGADWVFVEYRLETGHWMTGLQRPDGPEEIERDPERSNVQWLRRPTL